VALFESGIVQVNSAVGTIASLVWSPQNTSSTTFGSLGSVATTATLQNVTIQNQGSIAVYLSSGSIASGTPTLGLQLPVGAQLTIQGYSVTNPSGSAGQIWAQAGTVGTGQTVAGLASVASVV
jgi:flagellar basal body rod protein FlgF